MPHRRNPAGLFFVTGFPAAMSMPGAFAAHSRSWETPFES